MNTLGEKIRQLRNQKEMSQTKLGEYLGVAKTTISNYETGYSTPDNETLVKLSKYLNVSADYLLGISNDKNTSKEIPEEFSSPEEAMQFILKDNTIMGFGGFDVNKMSDHEVVEFANELLNQLRILSYKYKK